MLPAGQDAAEAFYRITDAAYERRSLAVTSNIHPSGFDTIMPKTLATATVDRLLHHAHLVQTNGESHRLAQALAGNAPFKATRYHSLMVERKSLPRELTVTADTDGGVIMALAHTTLPVHGVQFHPESIASDHGHLMLKNFLDIAAAWNASTGRRATPPQQSRVRAAR